MAAMQTKTLVPCAVVDTDDKTGCAYVYAVNHKDGYMALDSVDIGAMEQLRHVPFVVSAMFLDAAGKWCASDITPLLGQMDSALLFSSPLVLASSASAEMGREHYHSGGEADAHKRKPVFAQFPLRDVPKTLIPKGSDTKCLAPSIKHGGKSNAGYVYRLKASPSLEDVVTWYALLQLATSPFFGAEVVQTKTTLLGKARRSLTQGQDVFVSGSADTTDASSTPIAVGNSEGKRVVDLAVVGETGLAPGEFSETLQVDSIELSAPLHTAILEQLVLIANSRSDWVQAKTVDLAVQSGLGEFEDATEPSQDEASPAKIKTRYATVPIELPGDVSTDMPLQYVDTAVHGRPDETATGTTEYMQLDAATDAALADMSVLRDAMPAHPYCCCNGYLVLACTQVNSAGGGTHDRKLSLRQFPDSKPPTIALSFTALA